MNEAQNTQSTSGDSITFDYNKLYANNIQPTTPAPQEITTPGISTTPVMTQSPIVFDEERKNQTEVVTNVIPTFDTSALEGIDNQNLNTTEAVINSMKSESQQENEQYKKNLLFILAFFGVLIFAVVFLFPILAGY